MQKINRIVIVVAMLMSTAFFVSVAQNFTNSPYTRYGYGELIEPVSTAGRAMGGTAYATRGSSHPNFMNPASYSAVDSLTFMFDIAVSGYSANYKEGGRSENYVNGNLDYITMLFPVSKKLGVSFGIVPYSSAGYNFGSVDTTSAKVLNTYSGSGGISQFYVGAAFNLFKNFSLGVNATYMFGTLQHTYVPTFSDPTATSYSMVSTMKVSDFKFDIGLQYALRMSGNRQLAFGAVFSPGKNLNANTIHVKTDQATTLDTLSIYDKGFQLPMNLGFGVNYKWKQKYTLAADVQYQDWGSRQFYQKTDTLCNRLRAAAGFEYIPKLFDRAYGKNIRYRAGVNYTQSYLQINGNKVNELGVSIGAGLPLKNNRSLINFALEYISRTTPGTNYLKENYFRFTINMTVNEFWFFKNKFN